MCGPQINLQHLRTQNIYWGGGDSKHILYFCIYIKIKIRHHQFLVLEVRVVGAPLHWRVAERQRRCGFGVLGIMLCFCVCASFLSCLLVS